MRMHIFQHVSFEGPAGIQSWAGAKFAKIRLYRQGQQEETLEQIKIRR